MAETLYLEYGSSFDILDDLVEQAEAYFGAAIDDDDLVYRIVLLATEAVTNAIEHGNENDLNLKVCIWLDVSDSRAQIVVEDEGKGFDPRRLDSPLAQDRLLEASGRGVFLMEELADDVRWEKDCRRVTLRIDLPRA